MPAPTLLVLAASTYQVPVIRRARELGLRVLTADNRPENPGHALADAAFTVDTLDAEALCALAGRERVDGVIAAATDVALPAAAAVAARLGLPGPPPEAVATLCSKPAFRAFQRRLGLPCPEFRVVAPGEAAPAAGRWICKPDRSSGSKGIRIAAGDALADAVAQARRHALGGHVLLEAVIEGGQGTLEGVLQGGRLAACLPTDRLVAPAPHVATHGHRVPARLAPPALARLVAQIEAVAAALGLRDAMVDVDFVATAAEAWILEMTPRMGGNALMALVPAATGFALMDHAILLAIGRAAPLPRGWDDPAPTAVQILGTAAAGRLAYDAAEAEALRREPWVLDLTLDLPPGAPVEPFTDGTRRVGQALFQAPSRAALDARAAALLARLALRAT